MLASHTSSRITHLLPVELVSNTQRDSVMAEKLDLEFWSVLKNISIFKI